MAFFEQLGKRITDAGQTVAQQTKNLADVTQLNSSISEKERKISQLYLNMGQLYYEAHRADPAAEHQDILEAINALHAEIAQSRERIKQIKGVIKCPECGADVPLNAVFCNACGTKIDRDGGAVGMDAQAVRYCPACHAAVSAENAFCVNCGAKLDS